MCKTVITDLSGLLGVTSSGGRSEFVSFHLREFGAKHALVQKSMYPTVRGKVKSLILPTGLHLVTASLDPRDYYLILKHLYETMNTILSTFLQAR